MPLQQRLYYEYLPGLSEGPCRLVEGSSSATANRVLGNRNSRNESRPSNPKVIQIGSPPSAKKMQLQLLSRRGQVCRRSLGIAIVAMVSRCMLLRWHHWRSAVGATPIWRFDNPQSTKGSRALERVVLTRALGRYQWVGTWPIATVQAISVVGRIRLLLAKLRLRAHIERRGGQMAPQPRKSSDLISISLET